MRPVLTPGQPDAHISTDPVCGVVAAIVGGLFGSVAWGAILGFAGLQVGAAFGEQLLADAVRGSVPTTPPPIDEPPGVVRLTELRIESGGLTSLALLAEQGFTNVFDPRIDLVATLVSRTASTQPAPQAGVYDVPGTVYGCPAGRFAYTRRFFDTTFEISLISRDLPLPITPQEWWVQSGSVSYVQPGVVDPRPAWDAAPQPLAEPGVTLDGQVFVPEPPPAGQVLPRPAIAVSARASSPAGWRLALRGDDGNVYLRVGVTARDGAGALHEAEAFVSVEGDTLTFEPAYDAHQAACRQRFAAYFARQLQGQPPLVIPAEVGPGLPVVAPGLLDQLVLRRQIQAGQPSALKDLQETFQHGGFDAINALAALPELPVATD